MPRFPEDPEVMVIPEVPEIPDMPEVPKIPAILEDPGLPRRPSGAPPTPRDAIFDDIGSIPGSVFTVFPGFVA